MKNEIGMENELKRVLDVYDDNVKKFFGEIVKNTDLYQNCDEQVYTMIRNEVGTYAC